MYECYEQVSCNKGTRLHTIILLAIVANFAQHHKQYKIFT